MHSTSLIREIESAAYAAWPAAEVVEYDGWELRYAHGFSRRGNSVYPSEPSTMDRGLKLEWCSAWYADRGVGLVVRQNPATEPGLDRQLETLGYTCEGLTNVMVADLEPSESVYPVFEEAPPDWWTAQRALWGIAPNQVDAWRGIVDRIPSPVGFGLVVEDGEPIAAGVAAISGTWLGVFEVVVAPKHRKRGVGRGLTMSLMNWGANRAASKSFLQVVADNEAAIGLYESLGFDFAYPYWYRRAPA